MHLTLVKFDKFCSNRIVSGAAAVRHQPLCFKPQSAAS